MIIPFCNDGMGTPLPFFESSAGQRSLEIQADVLPESAWIESGGHTSQAGMNKSESNTELCGGFQCRVVLRQMFFY